MNVFKSGITLSVMFSSVLAAQAADAAWAYRVDDPIKPQITRHRTLTNPTIAQIRNAIAPHTRVDIVGEVDASNGDIIHVFDNDVRLNFARANKVRWSGEDRWEGFIETEAQRVQVTGLKFQVTDSSPGRCRGILLYSGAGDILVSGCVFNNIADGFVADGEWERVTVQNSKFLNCTDWDDSSMDGGYGMFLEDDDEQPDYLRISNVTVTLSSNSGQHGIRLSQVQNVAIEDSSIKANQKRSLWVYGAENISIANTTFQIGSVLFNLKPSEIMTDRPLEHVRMSNCRIDHDSILAPLEIYCGKGTVDFKMKNIDITSATSDRAMEVNWREDSGTQSRNISWNGDSITFNGHTMRNSECNITNDWSNSELNQLNIGAVH